MGRDGSIDWLCFPRPDSPAIFSHLLDDQHGGNFAVRVAEATVERCYLDGTNVLQTTWTTEDGGVLEVTDCMPVAPFDPECSRTRDTSARRACVDCAALLGRLRPSSA